MSGLALVHKKSRRIILDKIAQKAAHEPLQIASVHEPLQFASFGEERDYVPPEKHVGASVVEEMVESLKCPTCGIPMETMEDGEFCGETCERSYHAWEEKVRATFGKPAPQQVDFDMDNLEYAIADAQDAKITEVHLLVPKNLSFYDRF